MFTGGKQAAKLKEEFREHFRNISRIMDCVGCDKCRLWGKLQVLRLFAYYVYANCAWLCEGKVVKLICVL